MIDIRPRSGRRNYAKDGKVEEEDTNFPMRDRDIGANEEPPERSGHIDEKKSKKVFGDDVMDFPDKDMTIFPQHLDKPKIEDI